MDHLSLSTTVALLIAGGTIIYFFSPLFLRKIIFDQDGSALPPGPPIRYAFLSKYPERALDAWAKTYGPLFSVWMGSQLFVVVSDPQIARELLVTNGSIFSTRKRYFMKNQVILRGRAITASEYGDKWLISLPHIFIRSLFEEAQQGKLPINPAHYSGRFALNNMLIISFATRTDSTSDPLVEKALDLAMEFMDLTGPWSNAIDFLEPLQWIPSKMRTRGRILHDGLMEVYGSMILRVKARMDSGEDVPDCLVKTLIETQEEEKLDWEDLCMLSAVFTLGGVHSTSGIIQWFLALIPSYPEIQARAHEELDRVVGRDRWPTADDEADLPYIRAIIKEVQRVHAPFWMATPHCSSQDFAYKGMYIPKDTVVVLNCYTLHHNEGRYPDSNKFDPDRYLGDNLSCGESAKLANVMERDHWTFGAGRRICPGLPVAERELWLAISRLLWAFSFRSLPDEPISLEEYEGLSGRTPLPFRLKLTPRIDNLDEFLQTKEEITLQL
ncbi:cytochrome P450 [Lyophyllum atratum]|nr:cytochrome P450 [Lyophyllum atratum]